MPVKRSQLSEWLNNPDAPIQEGQGLLRTLGYGEIPTPPGDTSGALTRMLLRNALTRALASLPHEPEAIQPAPRAPRRGLNSPAPGGAMGTQEKVRSVYVPIMDDAAFAGAPSAVLKAREGVLAMKDPIGQSMAKLHMLAEQGGPLQDGARAAIAKDLHGMGMVRRGMWSILESHFQGNATYAQPPARIAAPVPSEAPRAPIHLMRVVRMMGGREGGESPWVELRFVKGDGSIRSLRTRLVRYEPARETLLVKTDSSPRRIRLYSVLSVNEHPTYF